MMRQDGMAEAEIAEALRRFDVAPENTRVEVGGRYAIIKWSITKIEPALDAPPISDIVPVKIAYEFLALHLGTAILDPGLDEVRAGLRDEPVAAPACRVERITSPSLYAPFHGIAVEPNAPHAVVQIRLFGGVGFRVHFERLAVGGDRLIYTHDLELGKEYAKKL
jgi:hypothetical protein